MNMKRFFLNYLVIVVLAATALFTACNKDKDGKGGGKITMTTKSDVVIIIMAGSGTVSINWGDGSKIETHTLQAPDYKYGVWYSSDDYFHVHEYPSASSRRITITGEDITYLDCSRNQLTELDVSKNSALIILGCNDNKLTRLDMSGLTSLRSFGCSVNQLASLDMSDCTALEKGFSCYSNLLTTSALNALFYSLPPPVQSGSVIVIYDNPGAYDCNRRIAENKGWRVDYMD